jgi:hypothetical protein
MFRPPAIRIDFRYHTRLGANNIDEEEASCLRSRVGRQCQSFKPDDGFWDDATEPRRHHPRADGSGLRTISRPLAYVVLTGGDVRLLTAAAALR